MPTPEIAEFLNYVDGLVVSTSNGLMEWTRANPTTVIWETKTPSPARMNLQLIDSVDRVPMAGGRIVRKRVKNYVFQVTDLSQSSPRIRLSVNGADDPVVNDKLARLYDLATSGLSKKGLDFLRNIMPT